MTNKVDFFVSLFGFSSYDKYIVIETFSADDKNGFSTLTINRWYTSVKNSKRIEWVSYF